MSIWLFPSIPWAKMPAWFPETTELKTSAQRNESCKNSAITSLTEEDMISMQLPPVCNKFTMGESPLLKADGKVTSKPCGTCQTQWEVQLEGRRSRRRGERPRRPESYGSGSVGPWWRTGPGTNPAIPQGSTSTNPPLQTEEKQKETKYHVQMFQSSRSTDDHKSLFGHTRQHVLEHYLHIGVCFKHLYQTSQSHPEDHVWGEHSQGCTHL